MNDQDEEAIFTAAIEIDQADERARYLEQACAGRPGLRASVDQLILMFDTDRSFLETPAVASAVGLPEEQIGETIDRYRLVRQIGEGGFGVVWEATQQHPVRRQVAVKIIRADVATSRFVTRFERERQTLALMNHPNVATVLDAGTTEAGHPYFAMELVNGESIDQFCDQRGYDAGQRARMLIDVCRAVQHAHQKGIVHRDLKPNNVLVTEIDGAPCIKMIDFGIAKALHEDSFAGDFGRTGVGLDVNQTADQAVAGTPHFMSPEQFRGDADIDTVADVYALGGIAYQLMTGYAPFEGEERQSVAQLRSLVCSDQTPQPPSRRESRLRGVTGADLRGDLDAIILRALSKDRAIRYPSASELGDEFQRYLDHQPVAARDGSPLYVIRKFARRYRAIAAAAMLAIAALVGGGAGVTLALLHAQQARQLAEREHDVAEQQRSKAERARQKAEEMHLRAEQELQNARQVAAMLQEMFGVSDPQRGLSSASSIHQQIDAFAAKLKDRAEKISSPSVRADLYQTIGRSYLALRSLDDARWHLEQALIIRRQLYAENDPRVFEVRLDYAKYLMMAQQRLELQRELNELIPMLRKEGQDELLVKALVFSSSTQVWGNRHDALKAAREALAASRAFHGKDHWMSLVQEVRVASQTSSIAADEASVPPDLAREATLALQELVERWPDHRFEIAVARGLVARVLLESGQLEASEQEYRRSTAAFSELLGESSGFAQRDRIGLARALHAQGKSEEAIRLAKDAVELAASSPQVNGRLSSRAFYVIETILYECDPENAEETMGRAIRAQRAAGGDQSSTVRLFRTQATTALADRRFSLARRLLEQCRSIHEATGNQAAASRVAQDLKELAESPEEFAAAQQQRRSRNGRPR